MEISGGHRRCRTQICLRIRRRISRNECFAPADGFAGRVTHGDRTRIPAGGARDRHDHGRISDRVSDETRLPCDAAKHRRARPSSVSLRGARLHGQARAA